MATHPLDPMCPQPYRLSRMRRETRDTFTIALEPMSSDSGVSFAPGQFTMLYVFGVGEVPISISGDPTRTGGGVAPPILVHTIRAVGTVTRAIRALKRGDFVGVRGPFGSRWPVEEARGNDVIIVAGGIGLAPLRPVVYFLLANRQRYGKIVLLYGTRTPQDLLYRRELERWRGRFDLNVQVTVDSSKGEWSGHVGVVTRLISRIEFEPLSTTVMMCGPEIMMRFSVHELLTRGVGPEHIWLSMERNMQCAIGLCGHCQVGPTFLCKDGPVFRYDRIQPFFGRREV
jgi:NAD(P)H-flavin reductase